MLHKLLQREVDDLPVLTLSRGDEKATLGVAQNKRLQVRGDVNKKAKDAFHVGRILSRCCRSYSQHNYHV
jgi:error-prone DNA polymerase